MPVGTKKYTREDLKAMQAWSLERKVQVTQTRIIEWYEKNNGKVNVSFSGGKDSTVLLDLVRRIYPDVEAVFVDTGLEFPEIRAFVETIPNVTWLKPIKPFTQVIAEYGFPVVSKDVSHVVKYAQRGSGWATNRLQGLNPDGTHSVFKQRYLKWKYLADAPFKVSDQCCAFLKERPLDNYRKTSGSLPIIGLIAEESLRRKDAFLLRGCNSFTGKKPRSAPLLFWTEQDILQYLKQTNLSYSSIYGGIVEQKGKLITTGEERTGCMFCMFGCHLDKSNRFQKMATTHPKQWDYCINKLGCGQVLDYIGVNYAPEGETE